jgi:hypothetical protein
MGLVLLASVTDPGRLVQKYGLMKTLSVPIRALTGGWKQIKMSARTAQLGGNAVDLVLHSRAHAFYDVFDGLRYGSKAERGVEWLTSKIGRIAFFDHWNVGMKSWAAVLENEVIMDSIATIMEGGSKKRVDKAIRELARRNLGEDDIQVIWEQVQAGGGGKINGVWLPETQNWDTTTKAGRDALRSYYSAMSGTLNETIITPGLERPLIVDQGPVAQMMFQFRSFAMSSITKTLLSNIQEHNMQTFNGMMVSIGLGMMSYYLYGVAKGGKDYEEMMNAPVEKWIDEGIIRSGQLAVLEDVMRAAQRIPATAPYASFSGTRSTVRSGGDFRDFFMGPTLDLAKDLGAVVTGLDDPTRHTLHMFRQLLPFQNHLFIRRGYDAIESQFNLPVKRSDR